MKTRVLVHCGSVGGANGASGGPARDSRGGFTLLELLLASLAASMILVAVYGIFQSAIHLRDNATQRTRDVSVRSRAEKTIRDDLRNAIVSGGILASVLAGDSSNPDNSASNITTASSIPGYLKFTTTTGRDDADNLYGDVQQVEYSIIKDPNATDPSQGGLLVRTVTRDILDDALPSNTAGGASNGGATGSSGSAGSAGSTGSGAGNATSTNGANPVRQENLLGGVQSFQVSFYDGSTWQTSWQFSSLETLAKDGEFGTAATTTTSSAGTSVALTTGQSSLPDAIRVDIQQAPRTANGPLPPPIEILVPWTVQPFAAATPATAGATPVPSP